MLDSGTEEPGFKSQPQRFIYLQRFSSYFSVFLR